MSKWDGWVETPLEASQIKQIAGRAGRFGMGAEGGIVTTLDPADLPALKAAMAMKPGSLRYARVGFIGSTIMDLFSALPRDTTVTTLRDALHYCSVLPPSMAVIGPSIKDADKMRYIDSFSQELAAAERSLLLQCPFPSMDDQCKAVLGAMFIMYRDALPVDLREILLKSGLLQSLEQVLAARQQDKPLFKPRQDLASLETLHSVLTVYAWLSFRNSIAFHAYDLAVALRGATQEAMDYCLRSVALTRRPKANLSPYVMRGPFVHKASSALTQSESI